MRWSCPRRWGRSSPGPRQAQGRTTARGWRGVPQSASRGRSRRAVRRSSSSRPRKAAPEERVRALRKEEHDRDQERAIDDEVDAGPATGLEVGARQLAERREDERAENWPEERPGPADDWPDDDLDGQGNAEHGIGLEREEVERVEGTPDAREKGRDRHRQHLVLERVDAERLGRRLVLADRREVRPEAVALDPGRDAGGREHHREGDVVVGAVVLELELARVAGERDVETERAPDRLRVERGDAADLGKGHRQEDEIEPSEAEAKAEIADDDAEAGGERP